MIPNALNLLFSSAIKQYSFMLQLQNQMKRGGRTPFTFLLRPLNILLCAVLLNIMLGVKGMQWELRSTQVLEFPLDVKVANLNSGQSMTVRVYWADPSIDVDFYVGLMRYDAYSSGSILGGRFTSQMPEVLTNFVAPQTAQYYVRAFPYGISENVDVRYEIYVSGSLVVNATGSTNINYLTFSVSGLCKTLIEVTDNTATTAFELIHSSANITHYLHSTEYQVNYTLELEKSDLWTMGVYRQKPSSLFSLQIVTLKFYEEISNDYIDESSTNCQLNCSAIDHSIYSLSNKYRCNCQEGYLWDSQSKVCRKKCGTDQMSFYKEGIGADQCSCPQGYSWTSGACRLNCSAIDQTVNSGSLEANECYCGQSAVWDNAAKVCYLPESSTRSYVGVIIICEGLAIIFLFLVILFYCCKLRLLNERKENIDRSLQENRAKKNNTSQNKTGYTYLNTNKKNMENQQSFHQLSSIRHQDDSFYSESLGVTMKEHQRENNQRVEDIQPERNFSKRPGSEGGFSKHANPQAVKALEQEEYLKNLRKKLDRNITDNYEKSKPKDLRKLREEFNQNLNSMYEFPKNQQHPDFNRKFMVEEGMNERQRMNEERMERQPELPEDDFKMNTQGFKMFQPPAPIIQQKRGDEVEEAMKDEDSDNSVDF